jgi:peptidoglycan/LPS O-acetylase OafA/YrhL
MSAAPIFAAKVPVGLMSGYLVARYLPEHGHQDGRTLWLIIALTTLTSPIGITLFERWIREPESAPAKPLFCPEDRREEGEEV